MAQTGFPNYKIAQLPRINLNRKSLTSIINTNIALQFVHSNSFYLTKMDLMRWILLFLILDFLGIG